MSDQVVVTYDTSDKDHTVAVIRVGNEILFVTAEPDEVRALVAVSDRIAKLVQENHDLLADNSDLYDRIAALEARDDT